MVLKGLRIYYGLIYLGEIITMAITSAQMELNQNLEPAQKELIVLNILKYK